MSLAERLAQTERPDRIVQVRKDLQRRLIEVLGPSFHDSTMSERDLRELVRRRLLELLETEETALSARERSIVVNEITDSVVGLGPLESLVKDPSVTEIMVNGPDFIYVER